MIEFVFKPSRTVAGRRVVSRLFSGRYAVEKGASPVTVRLNTPDREIARKRLRDIVLEKQREQEGIVSPKAVRTAAAASLGELVKEYETDLQGRGLDGKHVHDSVTRVRRMLSQTGWARLSDVRAFGCESDRPRRTPMSRRWGSMSKWPRCRGFQPQAKAHKRAHKNPQFRVIQRHPAARWPI